MTLECGKCGHTWRERISLPMRLDAFVSRLYGMLVCPNCGFKPMTNGKTQIYMRDEHFPNLKGAP